jgi:hypothetical protein
MRVLVTGCSTFFATRLIQELHAAGAEVTAADSPWISCGHASASVSRRVRLPRLDRHPREYLNRVLDELHARTYRLLLPTFEEGLLFAEHRDELPLRTKSFLPPFGHMLGLHDKRSLAHVCRRLGIPTPRTVMPSPANGRIAAHGLRFPVVLKLPMGNNSVGRKYCHSMDELDDEFTQLCIRQMAGSDELPFVQEMIAGRPIYTLMFCLDGRKLGEVIYRPLRTFPEDGGTSAHRESIEHPEISKITSILAAETAWSGFLGLDFIEEHRTDVPYLIDANPRPNPAVALGYACGVDWTRLLLECVAGRDPQPMFARPGIRNRSLLLDCGWLLEGLRPQPGWLHAAAHRIRHFRHPGWSLVPKTELLDNCDWRYHLAMTAHSLLSLGKSFVTGAPLGQVIMEGANYRADVASKWTRRSVEPSIPQPHFDYDAAEVEETAAGV